MAELLNGTLFDVRVSTDARTYTNRRRVNFNKQELVVKRVMTAALADSVQHKREKVREKIKEKAADARASLNETRAAMRKKIFGGKEG